MFGRHAVHAYLLLGRQPIVVDAGTPSSGRLIHDQVAAHGVGPKDVRLIVVTHGHLPASAPLRNSADSPTHRSPAISPTSASTRRAGAVSRTCPSACSGGTSLAPRGCAKPPSRSNRTGSSVARPTCRTSVSRPASCPLRAAPPGFVLRPADTRFSTVVPKHGTTASVSQ
ncbi:MULTISPECIES: MBL fold metallo-hydrolase [Streptomyces]|uniref:MBL fold metallo-hydrolase n=1 Tax=Streptomyces TaxID=1883 RepID=UPI001F5BAFFE|nr:MBL fold metallo-hydrolase [Streptomyces avermitilis]